MATLTTSSAVKQLSDANSKGTVLGQSTTDLIGFYGTATPVAQRANANQATSAVVTSASFGTLQVAQIQELQLALIALNLIKGSA